MKSSQKFEMTYFGAMNDELRINSLVMAELMGVSRAYFYRLLTQGREFDDHKEKMVREVNKLIARSKQANFEDAGLLAKLQETEEELHAETQEKLAQRRLEQIRLARIIREQEAEYAANTKALNHFAFILENENCLSEHERSVFEVLYWQLLHSFDQLNPTTLARLRMKLSLVEREIELLTHL
jgi:hypothetical protein